ncbi:MAG TPA: Spy/CpxP family protein refolding chaperone [Pyrinomonadaceae bacterium]|jgi:Spy/CpxP family protein refolding chaperone
MKRVTVLIGSLAIVLTSFVIAAAQDPPASTNAAPNVQQRQRGRMARRMGRRHARRRALGALRTLNLTDAQKQQAREIRRANFESTKTQRQELAELRRKFREGTLTDDEKAKAKELRQQLHASRQNTRTQLAALLTPEQKTKLDEMIKNRRENRGRFGRRGPMANKPL